MTNVKEGDRIELVYTDDPYTKLRHGDRGTVLRVSEVPFDPRVSYQLMVRWDSGSRLSLIIPPDDYKVLRDEKL